jgi:polyisoprenoid-binding protein YceI
MSRPIFAALALLALALTAPAAQQPAQPPLPTNGWRIDLSHSAVSFRVRHLGISWVNGRFTAWQGALIYDPADPTASSVTATIATNSVNTQNERRDADIRSGNYLAVDSFPEMKFVSRRVEKVDDTHLKITGDLTIRGVTRSVVLDTEMLGMLPGQRSRRVAFTATTVIDRNNFGVSFNRLMEGAAIVGAEVQITIDIEAIQPVGG